MERIILLIVQKPFSSDFLFDVGEREFLPSYLFFVYRLVCNRILGMVPESVEGFLQHHVSSENNTMGPSQRVYETAENLTEQRKKSWETAVKYSKATNIIPSVDEFWCMEDLE